MLAHNQIAEMANQAFLQVLKMDLFYTSCFNLKGGEMSKLNNINEIVK